MLLSLAAPVSILIVAASTLGLVSCLIICCQPPSRADDRHSYVRDAIQKWTTFGLLAAACVVCVLLLSVRLWCTTALPRRQVHWPKQSLLTGCLTWACFSITDCWSARVHLGSFIRLRTAAAEGDVFFGETVISEHYSICKQQHSAWRCRCAVAAVQAVAPDCQVCNMLCDC